MSDGVRDLLRTLDEDVRRADMPAPAVLRRRGELRRRSHVVVVSLVALLILVGALVAVHPRNQARLEPTGPSPAPSPAPVLDATPGLMPASPGQHVRLGAGTYVWLTASGKCFRWGGVSESCTTDDIQAGKVSCEALGVPDGVTYVTGVYRGTDAARITVTVNGVTLDASVLRLVSHPHLMAYGLVVPLSLYRTPLNFLLRDSFREVVLVYDAAGHLLARYPPT